LFIEQPAHDNRDTIDESECNKGRDTMTLSYCIFLKVLEHLRPHFCNSTNTGGGGLQPKGKMMSINSRERKPEVSHITLHTGESYCDLRTDKCCCKAHCLFSASILGGDFGHLGLEGSAKLAAAEWVRIYESRYLVAHETA